MYINVAQLLKEPVGSTRRYKVDELIGEEGTTHVQGEVILTHTNRSVLVQGTITAQCKDICTRCLEPADISLTFDVEDEYFPTIDILSGLPLPRNPDTLMLDENHVLDLSEVLEQYLVMSVPMKVLCHPDCAGICRGDSVGFGPTDSCCKPDPSDFVEIAFLLPFPSAGGQA